MLQTLADHRLIISIIASSKAVHCLIRLFLLAHFGLYWVNFVLVIDKSRIVGRLGHLSEVASLAKAHRNLSIVSFHVSMERLRLFLCLSVDSFEDLFKAIIDWVNIIRASILYRERLFKSCNAGRLSEFLLVANLSQMCRASLSRLLPHGGWIVGRWRRWLSHKVLIIFRVPGRFGWDGNAYVRVGSPLGF